ncbi:hypothetical protein AURDEDRAFT_140927 [Auricularia subglabra TFB-10046 SS5]|nr:hypothetical protein AURDEDRAFT_140927 [Auricularia subglabra TFB-10046 SS5]
MKYILEAAIIQADLLNRTVVLPSFVYARDCELRNNACATFLPMVNRGDALNSDEWRELPMEDQMAWKVPMGLMIDMKQLRKHHSVLLVSEYLRLHNLRPSLEASTGRWLRDAYHEGPHAPSLFVIQNTQIDPTNIVLVDTFPGTFEPPPPSTPLSEKLAATAEGRIILNWMTVRRIVGGSKTDEKIEGELVASGWHSLYTFHSMVTQELFKAPVYPIREAAPHGRMRGFAEYYAKNDEDVILLAGETHLYRKPGGLRYTSVAARDNFARLVLRDMKYRDQVDELAAVLERRMRDKVGGRMFLAAHMRRGDFARLHWAMSDSLEQHLHVLKTKFQNARRFLRNIKNSKLTTYVVPDVELDARIWDRKPPASNDPFFLMSDERSEEGMKYLREHGAVLVQDLLTPQDRQNFGWPIIFTDILALVEQSLAARSDYFVGQAFSSVTGTVIELRAAKGKDPQTGLLVV